MKRILYAAYIAIVVLLADCGCAEQSIPELTQAAALSRIIDMSQDGYIIIPAEKGYEKTAKALRKALKSSYNTRFSIITELDPIKNTPANVIAIGHTLNNPFVELMYWNKYTRVTPIYPGENGFVIESAFNPLPILPEHDAIILGVSNPESAAEAVDAFKDILSKHNEKKLPMLFELSGSAKKMFSEKKFKQHVDKGQLNDFMALADLYHTSGDERYKDAAYEILLKVIARFDLDWSRRPMWQEEINSWQELPTWDFFAEHLDISDAEQLRVEQFFLNYLYLLPKFVAQWKDLDENLVLNWNHTTIPLGGIYANARYFKAHYGMDEQMDPFLERVRYGFDNPIPYYRPLEEAPAYIGFAVEFNLYHCLMTGRKEYFKLGHAEKIAKLLLMQSDNNGHYAGQGDSGLPYFRAVGFSMWPTLDYYLKSGEIRWFDKNCDQQRFLSPFYDNIEPKAPESLVGCIAVMLDTGMYEYLKKFPVHNEPIYPPDFPIDKTLEKLQFRSSTDLDADYLLLDGFGRGRHMHLDTNNIVCYTAGGYRFLFDADYLVRKSNDHSMLSVVQNGRSEKMVPSTSALYDKADFAWGAYTRTGVVGYNGVHWQRHILWMSEKYFLVFDTVEAEKEGDYSFDCVWKVLDRGMETFDGKNLVCRAPVHGHKVLDRITKYPPVTFHLKSSDEGGWWKQRVASRYKLPGHTLHQNRSTSMKPGDLLSYQNVFYIERPATDGTITQHTPTRISERAMLLESNDKPYLILVQGGSFNKIKTDAVFCMLGQNEMIMVNGTTITKNGTHLVQSTTPLSMSVHNSGVEIISDKEGSCIIAGEKLKYEKGTTQHVLKQPLFAVDISEKAAKLRSVPSKKEQALPGKASWQPETGINTEQSPGRDMVAKDIDGDTIPELLICSGKELKIYRLDGRPVWSYQHEAGIYSTAAADIDGDGAIEILVGTGDTKLLILDTTGKLIDTKNIPIEQSGSHGVRSSLTAITHIKIHDIDKDGDNEIFLGMEAWQIQMYDHTFTRLWYFTLIYHGVTGIDFADMDGDEIEEIIASDRYGSVRILDWRKDDHLLSIKTYTAISDAVGAVVDIDGDGINELVNASDAGHMTLFKRPETIKLVEKGGSTGSYSYDEVWQFNNYGYGFKDLALQSTETGEAVLAASETGYIYSIDPKTAQTNWMTHLDSNVIEINVQDDNSVLAGTAKGNLYLLTQGGQIRKKASLHAPIVRITQSQQDQAVVLDKTGHLYILNTETK
jgi:outer membrane protein assembly factor BamB